MIIVKEKKPNNPEEMIIKLTEYYHWKDFTISNLFFFF